MSSSCCTTTLLLAALSLGVWPGTLPSQSLDFITESGLGFPVPEPVDSLTPVAGFRSYGSLRARFDDLWLQKDHITRMVTGESVHGREIISYRFSTEGDRTPDGVPKSGAFLEGGLHAREWAGPEVVATVFEWLALEAETDPVAAYLLDSTVTVIHPLANPDGLVLTQSNFDRTVDGGPAGTSGRDGRMRRKNLRDCDEILETVADHLLGVDLNRNHTVGFGGGSASASSLTHRGARPGSEPESAAIYAAGELARVEGEERLRFHVDFHSFGQLYYLVFGESAGRNATVNHVYTVMRGAALAVTGRSYSSACVDLGGTSPRCDRPIGATDEYFAGTTGCVSYTCEIRPAASATSNGFVLPDREVEATRLEHLAATRSALYAMAGPPALVEVSIFEAEDLESGAPEPAYRQGRVYDELTGQRALLTDPGGSLEIGQAYVAALKFTKPMRLPPDGAGGAPGSLPGQPVGEVTVTLGENLSGSEPSWVFSAGGPIGYWRYPGDTLLVTLDLGAVPLCPGNAELGVLVTDMAGQALDADVRTVSDWSADGWVFYENAEGRAGVSGGADRFALVPLLAPRGDAPCEISVGDCNGNCLADLCEIASGELEDLDGNGIPDSCELFRRGDVNADDLQDLTDAVVSLGHQFLGEPASLPCARSADIDANGALEITDPVAWLEHIFLGGPAPRAPAAVCGLDPEPGGLPCDSFPPCLVP